MSIGTIKGNTLYKFGKQVQLFRLYDGFAVDEKVFDYVDRVEIKYQGKVYRATRETFKTKGIPYQHNNYEPQLVLPRKDFDEH